MSSRDVIVDALCAVWGIADAERDADGILSALHSAGYVVAKVPDKQDHAPLKGSSAKQIGTFYAVSGWNACRAAMLASTEETS